MVAVQVADEEAERHHRELLVLSSSCSVTWGWQRMRSAALSEKPSAVSSEARRLYTTQRNRRCNSISTGQRLNTGNGRTHIKNKDRKTAAASSLSLLPPVTALRQQNCVAACQSFQLDQRKSSSMRTALLLNKSLCFSAELCSTSRGTSHVRICALGLSSLLLLSFNYSIRVISTNDGCTLIISSSTDYRGGRLCAGCKG